MGFGGELVPVFAAGWSLTVMKRRLESKPLTKLRGVRLYCTSKEYNWIVQQTEASVLEQCSGSAVLTSYILLHTISIQVIYFKLCATASDDSEFSERFRGIAGQDAVLAVEKLSGHYAQCPAVFQDIMLPWRRKCLYSVAVG